MIKPTSDRLDAYFDYLTAISPPSLRAWTATDEITFCSAVEDAIHLALTQIEAGAKLYHPLQERALSLLLTQFLTSASLPADAEAYHNGHVDVIVKHPASLPFAMLGECKIYGGFEHHCEGCEQLLTRYSNGRSRRTFCLDFFRKPEMYKKLQRLREQFENERPLDQVGVPADHKIKGAFLTAHRHFTATILEVLHLGCNLYHPEMLTRSSLENDKSIATTSGDTRTTLD